MIDGMEPAMLPKFGICGNGFLYSAIRLLKRMIPLLLNSQSTRYKCRRRVVVLRLSKPERIFTVNQGLYGRQIAIAPGERSILAYRKCFTGLIYADLEVDTELA